MANPGGCRRDEQTSVVLTTSPRVRYQNLGGFNMFFNAVMHFNDVGR